MPPDESLSADEALRVQQGQATTGAVTRSAAARGRSSLTSSHDIPFFATVQPGHRATSPGMDDDPLDHAELGQATTGAITPSVVATARDDCGIPWLTTLGFAFLTFNSGLAIYGSQGDAVAVAIVVFSYVYIFLLIFYLRSYERRGGFNSTSNSARIRVVRAMVWVLTFLLTGLFGLKIASVMPFPAAVAVWALSVAGVVGVFNAFFLNHATARPEDISSL